MTWRRRSGSGPLSAGFRDLGAVLTRTTNAAGEGAATQPEKGRFSFARAKWALHKDNRRLLAEMIRYAFVSGLAFVVDFATMYVCIHFLHMSPMWATTIGFCLGIVTNFITSKTWVFDNSRHRRSTEMGLFLLVGVTGLGLNNLIVWFAHYKLGIWAMVSKLISTAVVFFWNFLLRRFLIYTGQASGSESND